MGEYHIKGGTTLSGEINIAGGKNAVLPILAATILIDGVSVIHNCPKITDTSITVMILEALGCKVKTEDRTITVDSRTLNNSDVPAHLVKEMRSSIIFLGGLLGRFKKVKISYPGGCENFRRFRLYNKNCCQYRITGAFRLAYGKRIIYNQDYINRDYIIEAVFYVYRAR